MTSNNPEVLLTRNRGANDKLAVALAERGVSCVSMPLIDISAIADTSGQFTPEAIASYDWLLFTSANGARFFFDGHWLNRTAPPPVSVATMGSHTREAVEEMGFTARYTASSKGIRDMWQQWSKAHSLIGKRILYPCSQLASDEIVALANQIEANVDKLEVYTATAPKAWNASIIERVQTVVLYSPSAVANLFRFWAPNAAGQIPHFVVSGPTTHKALAARGAFAITISQSAKREDVCNAVIAARVEPPK